MTVMRPDLVRAGAMEMNVWRLALAGRYDGRVPRGLVLYHGPSALGAGKGKVVVVITGLTDEITNEKTGDMLQVYIMPANARPGQAVRSGADAVACGDCKHRPFRGGVCYVNVGWGPSMVYRAWRAGNVYEECYEPAAAAAVLAGSTVRFGAWGDPAAVPLNVWEPLLGSLRAYTGYTHQWRNLGVEWQWLMASVDSMRERREAKAAGWRTFRVKEPEEELDVKEHLCLASERGIPCSKCRGCDGNASGRQLDFAIDYHGPDGANAWRERQGWLFPKLAS